MCGTGNPVGALWQQRVMGWKGGGKWVQEGGDTCVPMAHSCWCMAGAITILWSIYSSIKRKKEIKGWHKRSFCAIGTVQYLTEVCIRTYEVYIRTYRYIYTYDDEAEAPILWPPDSETWVIGKDHDAGKDWGGQDNRGWDDWMASSTQCTRVWANPRR